MPADLRTRPAAGTVAVLGLLAVTATWGSTFFLLKDVVTRIPVTDFLAWRFALAAAGLLLLRPAAVLQLTASDRRRGAAMGLVYGAAQLVQTIGLQTTSASVSGFITGMYVVFTPLLGLLLLRSRTGWHSGLAVVLATAGLAVLSLRGLSIGSGELLTLLSALLYAVHIVGLGAWSTARNAYGLAVVQLLVIAVLCTAGALPGGLAVPDRGPDWLSLVYMALVAGALALVLQTWAQAHLAASRAAVIMTMEPVWAGLFAVLFGGEVLGPRVVLGGALVLGAMYLAELGQLRLTA